MEMIKFVETIFQELSFEHENSSFDYEQISHPFVVFTRGKSAYVVIEIKSNMVDAFKDFFTSYQPRFFESTLKCKNFREDFKKNSYLLVIVEDKISKEYQRKFFINIEEDPFFFKKYVLRYNDDALKELVERIVVQKNIDGLGHLAIDHKIFKKFSEESKNRAGFESLLYQLYVKIPALSLPTNSKDIGNLSLEIKNKLAEEDLKNQSEKIWDLFETLDEKAIDLKVFNQIMGQL